MARKSLPKGVTYDAGAGRYRVQYKDAKGKWRVEHAGTNKQAAVRLLASRKPTPSAGTHAKGESENETPTASTQATGAMCRR